MKWDDDDGHDFLDSDNSVLDAINDSYTFDNGDKNDTNFGY